MGHRDTDTGIQIWRNVISKNNNTEIQYVSNKSQLINVGLEESRQCFGGVRLTLELHEMRKISYCDYFD